MIQGVPVDVLINNGSTISLNASSLLKYFNCAQKSVYRVLTGLGSQELESTFYVTLPIEFDSLTLKVVCGCFRVHEQACDCRYGCT